MGSVLACIAALVIGNRLPPRDAMGVDYRTVGLAVAAGASCGYTWWWFKAGDLPVSMGRALVLAGAVTLSVLGFASTLAAPIVAGGLKGGGIWQVLGFVLFWL